MYRGVTERAREGLEWGASITIIIFASLGKVPLRAAAAKGRRWRGQREGKR